MGVPIPALNGRALIKDNHLFQGQTAQAELAAMERARQHWQGRNSDTPHRPADIRDKEPQRPKQPSYLIILSSFTSKISVFSGPMTGGPFLP